MSAAHLAFSADGARARVVAGIWNVTRGAVFLADAAVYTFGFVLKPPLAGFVLYDWMTRVSPWVWGAVHVAIGLGMLIARRVPAWGHFCCKASTVLWAIIAGVYVAAAPADPAWTSAMAAASLSYLACARASTDPL